MKPIFLSAVMAGGLATWAVAATELDTNGDGMLTLDEVQTVYPEITAETFSAMDANADGALDETEIAAAQDAGMMPKG
ncbi:hypothetical protein [Sedimentitalea arenosa]|jgi:Ca2+-binding EF-hand superfamily protein|uniref:EF-hand domain-containing protein n=1 Tax=Sedimentitalea arenosa TaxID=2798803 RepID=A0A8J7LV23_9RHOB|nr:hypothetical protein [Arenibacterium arenosum]MBJ6370311.1 hypothetical protein [Arenibacterium arenosum]